MIKRETKEGGGFGLFQKYKHIFFFRTEYYICTLFTHPNGEGNEKNKQINNFKSQFDTNLGAEHFTGKLKTEDFEERKEELTS